jgi:hypothetical protein
MDFQRLGDPGNRSDEAKLTACRKVGRMYRRSHVKSSIMRRKVSVTGLFGPVGQQKIAKGRPYGRPFSR